jgi:hypothetical protein
MTKKSEIEVNAISQETVLKLDAEILQVEKDYRAELARLDAERGKVTKAWETRTNKLQAERSAVALAIKLKGYPDKLVKEHKTCSVCGADMRPFMIAQGETVKKLWACAAGNLSELHDLVTVE